MLRSATGPNTYRASRLTSRISFHKDIRFGNAVAYTTISPEYGNKNDGEISGASSNPNSLPSTDGSAKVDRRASAKLWADAAEEEEELARRNSSSSRLAQYREQQQEFPNWTGDESVQDAVLRMLVDKYKPLRTGTIKSSEEKLKNEKVVTGVGGVNVPETDEGVSMEEITAAMMSTLPPSTAQSLEYSSETPASSSEHKPWLVTFRIPSHVANVRQMRLPPPPPIRPSQAGSLTAAQIHPDDTRMRNAERDRRRKAAQAGRLTNARDSTLDYRLGKMGEAPSQSIRPNPVTVKGWASLVEERIERARNEGQFRTLKGRGKPLLRENEASNPFIAREEFLMNRIVQRQGAAPPWVEYQGELESAISTFRSTLRSTWIRRAVRSLVTSNPPEFLSRLTLKDTPIRDLEWEKREEGYHKEAVEDINRLVRKYNGVAPYAVRRAYMLLNVELDRMYEECREDILKEVRMRGQRGEGKDIISGAAWDDDDEWGIVGGGGGGGVGPAGGSQGPKKKFRLADWWDRMVARWAM